MVKMCKPRTLTFRPHTKSDPKLLPITASKNDDAPVLLTQFRVKGEIWNSLQQLYEPGCSLNRIPSSSDHRTNSAGYRKLTLLHIREQFTYPRFATRTCRPLSDYDL